MAAQTELNAAKMEDFLSKVLVDVGSALSSVLVVIADRLGFYKALAGAPPMTPSELAAATGTTEHYVREWLVNQAAGGYIEYTPSTGRYSLSAEHAAVLADERSPYFMCGGFQVLNGMMKADERITCAFRTGEGMFWGEHHNDVFEGTERFFRTGYAAHLTSSWIPALDGVQKKLEAGALVADLGCGYGASTIIMAEAFPNSRFFGFDNHAPSIVHARKRAFQAGVAFNTTFDIAGATSFPHTGYDLITYFDCLHDLGDPKASLKHAGETLKQEGTIMIVEPMAAENVEGNSNPIGRIFSGTSVLCCTPNAIASGQTVQGTIATERQLRAVAEEAGFVRFRRVAETQFNRVFEVRLR